MTGDEFTKTAASGAPNPGAHRDDQRLDDQRAGGRDTGAQSLSPDLDAADDHDPLGLDVAASIAHQISGGNVVLPPPRGVRRRRDRRQRPGPQRSGAGPDERDPQRLGAAFDRLISERGWGREVNVRTLLTRWSELVGPVNAEHSRPESYADGVLTVRTESTTWATSLRSLAPRLVAELNARLGDGSVTRIVVLGPAAPSWKHGRRSVRDGRGPRDTYG